MKTLDVKGKANVVYDEGDCGLNDYVGFSAMLRHHQH